MAHFRRRMAGHWQVLFFMFATANCSLAFAAPAHEHGVANLDVVIEGNKLQVNLSSPLHNLVGFEHAPRNDQQRAALVEMDAALLNALVLLRPSPEAGCTLADVRVDQPFSQQDKTAKHAGHQHADAQAVWSFVCTHPERLRQLEVLFFERFPGMQRIKVQSATPRGQSSAVLTPSRRRLNF